MKKFEGDDKSIVEIRERNRKEIYDDDEVHYKRVNGLFE